MLAISCQDNAAALFESSIARKIMKYCIISAKCLDSVKGFDDLSSGKCPIFNFIRDITRFQPCLEKCFSTWSQRISVGLCLVFENRAI